MHLMRIAVIGPKGLPPQQGGIEHHCAEIYPRLASKGHAVDFYARASYNHAYPGRAYRYKGVRVINIPCLDKKGIDALTTSVVATLCCLAKNYDVVHFHAVGPAIFAWLPKFATQTKVIVTCHGLDWQRNKWGSFASSFIRVGEKVAVRFADEVIVVAENLQSYFYDTYGRQTTYICNGPANYAESDPTFSFGRALGLEQDRYLVFLGRLVPEKNVHRLIEAYQALQPEGWKLAIVGGSSDTTGYVRELRDMVAGSDSILFTGFLRGEQLAEIMRGAGVFVLPSAVEGQPLALLEAMAEKIPCIASDIPIHRQVLGGDRGLLFHVDEPASLVAQLRHAIDNPALMEQRALRASRYVKTHHNWDDIVEQHLALYGFKPASVPARPSVGRIEMAEMVDS